MSDLFFAMLASRHQSKFFLRIKLFAVPIFVWSSSSCFASDLQFKHVGYDLEAKLLYTDRITSVSRPAKIDQSAQPRLIGAKGTVQESQDLQIANSTQAQSERTLGLQSMKLGFDWEVPRRIRARLVLRPDVDTSNVNGHKELDTTSGPRFSEVPSVELLDEYELTMLRGDFSFGVGVRDHVVPESEAYREVLGHHMEVMFPRKTFGFHVVAPTVMKLSSDGQVSLLASLLSSSGDRHKSKQLSQETGDESPSKRSPYWGGVIYAALHYGDRLSAGGGFVLDETKGQLGKVTRHQYLLGAKQSLSLGDLPSRMAIDLRQDTTTYRSESLKLANTQLTSGAVTLSSTVLPERDLLVGLRLGTGSRQSEETSSEALRARSMQTEVGVRGLLGDGLEVTGLVTREYCVGRMEADGQGGCFGPIGGRKKFLSRFAMSVTYQTGGSL